MLVGIHQPHYLPWPRYFEKVARSDVFIVLDNIQFSKNGWQNRNRIKTSAGSRTLTVPVVQRCGQNLSDTLIDNTQAWRKKHLASIQQAYAHAPCFSLYRNFLTDLYGREWELLNVLNRSMFEYFLAELGIATRIAYASELNVSGEATERLINLVKAVGGDTYYSGAYALDAYLSESQLQEAGIALRLQQWTPRVYSQLHGDFVPELATLDLMMNCGRDALDLILEGGNT